MIAALAMSRVRFSPLLMRCDCETPRGKLAGAFGKQHSPPECRAQAVAPY